MKRIITFEQNDDGSNRENQYFQEALYNIENMKHNLEEWANNIGSEKAGVCLQLFKNHYDNLVTLYQQDEDIFARQCYENLAETCAPILSYRDSVEHSIRSADFALGRKVEKIAQFLDALFDQWAECRNYSDDSDGLGNLFG